MKYASDDAWREADVSLYHKTLGRREYTRRLQLVVTDDRIWYNLYWARGKEPEPTVELSPIDCELKLVGCVQILIAFFGVQAHIGSLMEALNEEVDSLLRLVEKLAERVQSFYEVASGIRKAMMEVTAKTDFLTA